MYRLSFGARFAVLLIVLGGLIAGSTVAILLSLAGGESRQAALDRVSERAQTADQVVRAERTSLRDFATAAAKQFADGGDPATFVARVSRAAAASDVVGVLVSNTIVAAQAGTVVDGARFDWLRAVGSAGAPGSMWLASDGRGSPWIYAAAQVPSQSATLALAARPLSTSVVRLLTAPITAPSGGLVVVENGRAVINGTLAGAAIRAGDALSPTWMAVTAAPTMSTIVGVGGQDFAVVSETVSPGSGFTLLVTSQVDQGQSALQTVATPVVLVSALLMVVALILLFILVQRDLQRPLRRLDRAVSALAGEDFSVPVAPTTNPELARLGGSFEEMRREFHAMLRGVEARAAVAADLGALSPLASAVDAVCARLRTTTHASSALAVLLDEDGVPTGVHASGLPKPPPTADALVGGGGLVAAACETRTTGSLLACALPGSVEHGAQMREIAAAPVCIGSRALGAVAIADRPGGFTRHDLDLLAVVADHLALAVEREHVLEHARVQANTDGLTGLYNRHFLTGYLDQKLLQANRARTPLTLLMLDIDNFKRINDSFGHEAGDSALRCVARTLGSSLRGSDLAARLGGDEFVVVMEETELANGVLVAEKLRDAVSRTELIDAVSRRPIALSVSIGVAMRRPHGLGIDRLLTLADNALYEAKRMGRNRVCVARDDPPPIGQEPV